MKSFQTFLLCASVSIAGCAKYVQVESDLVDQARRGVQMTAAALGERAKIIDQYHALQRKLLDEAFDQDVRERSAPTADWIIEHRRGYATGLDALAVQKRASDDAAAVDQRTLVAIDQALEQLKWLQSIESKWASLPVTSAGDNREQH